MTLMMMVSEVMTQVVIFIFLWFMKVRCQYFEDIGFYNDRLPFIYTWECREKFRGDWDNDNSDYNNSDNSNFSNTTSNNNDDDNAGHHNNI